MSEIENITLENENFFNLGNDYFSLKGYRCLTGVDVVNLWPGEIKQTLKTVFSFLLVKKNTRKSIYIR